MRALVIGRSGQIARALAARSGRFGCEVVCRGRDDIDVLSRTALASALQEVAPAILINAAAFTAVDQAEQQPEAAYALNATVPTMLAELAAARELPLLHMSTDYVFAGDKPTPYLETDPTAPQSVYGASKLAGEQGVLSAHPGALVVRTAWIYDRAGKNFVRTMLRLATSRSEIGVVADQVGCPTFAEDLADGLLTLAQGTALGTPAGAGLYHLAAAGEASWADFASAIFAGAAQRGGPSAVVRPIASAAYPTLAKRPANSRLDCTKIALIHAITLPQWQNGLARCLDQIAEDGWVLE